MTSRSDVQGPPPRPPSADGIALVERAVLLVLLRWRNGASIWTSDRRHFSHRLVRRGMTVPKAVLCIWLATLVTALPALLLPRASWPLACGIGVQTLLVVGLVALLESGAREETPKG